MCRFIFFFIFMMIIHAGQIMAETKPLRSGAFQIFHSVTLPGSPEILFDQVTGDIGGWWDHSMSENPLKWWFQEFHL